MLRRLSPDVDNLNPQQVSALVKSLGPEFDRYGAKIVSGQICGGILTSLSEQTLEELLKVNVGVVHALHIGQIIKLLRGQGPTPILDFLQSSNGGGGGRQAEAPLEAQQPAKRQHIDGDPPPPPPVAATAAAAPAPVLQAGAVGTSKQQLQEAPKEQPKKKKQGKSDDGGRKPKPEAAARPKAPPSPPRNLPPPPPGYKGPPSKIASKAATRYDSPPPLGKRQARHNNSTVKNDCTVNPTAACDGHTDMDADVDVDEQGWSNACSLCGVDGAQMLCCEFGIDADDPDACAVCSNAVCYGCAGVDVEPPGAFICGDHQTSTLAATPAAAVAAPKSNSRILLITCPTPDNYSLLLPRPLSSPGRKHDLHAVWLVEVFKTTKIKGEDGEDLLELKAKWWCMPQALRNTSAYRNAYRGSWLVSNPQVTFADDMEYYIVTISPKEMIKNFGRPTADFCPAQLFTQENLEEFNAFIQTNVGDVNEETVQWQKANAPVDGQ